MKVYNSEILQPHHFSLSGIIIFQNSTAYRIQSLIYHLQNSQSGQNSDLHRRLNVQYNRTTRSSDFITLQRPLIRSK